MKASQFESLFKHSVIAVAASLLLVGCGAEEGKESFSDRVAKQFEGKETKAANSEKESEKSAATPEPAKPSPVETTIQAAEEIATDVGEKASEVAEDIKTEVNESIDSLATMAIPSAVAPAENLKAVVKPTPDIIRQLQQALTDAGYSPGPVDGKNGGKTTEAMKKFQEDNSLTVGQITEETLVALGIAY